VRRLTSAELRPGTSATLFVFAGAGGDAEEIAPLAHALGGDRRVVALAPTARPGEGAGDRPARPDVPVLRAPDGYVLARAVTGLDVVDP